MLIYPGESIRPSGRFEFYLISVKQMKSSWHPSHRMIFVSLVLESYEILESELDGIQCNVVSDSIGGSKEQFAQK